MRSLFSIWTSLRRLFGRCSSEGCACNSAGRSLSDGAPERTLASVGEQTETTSHQGFSDKIRQKFRGIELSKNDESLYKVIRTKATAEKYKFQHYGTLRVILESGKEVVIKLGKGKEEILFFYEDGEVVWTSSGLPVIKYDSKNPFLRVNDVQNATENLLLNESEKKLVNFAEDAIWNGVLGKAIQNATLTITFDIGKRIEINHGNRSLQINVKYVDGKPTCRWQYPNGDVPFTASKSAILPSFTTLTNGVYTCLVVGIAVYKVYDLIRSRLEDGITRKLAETKEVLDAAAAAALRHTLPELE